MIITVTGGAGFIGSHLCDALAPDNDLTVIDDLSSGLKSNVGKGARLVVKDILSDLSGTLSGSDALFHFAADPSVQASSDNPGKTFDINVTGTVSVLEACRKADVRSFVLASSSAVYGTAKTPTPETSPCFPISNYGASKLAAEAYACAYSETYGIRTTVLRYANIFGPRNRHGVIHDLYAKLRSDRTALEVLGSGRQEKSYMYISDCIGATRVAWEKQKRPFDVFNIGTTRSTRVDELVRMVSARFRATPTIIKKEGWKGDVQMMLLDITKIQSLGYKEQVGLERGMADYLTWLEKGENHG